MRHFPAARRTAIVTILLMGLGAAACDSAPSRNVPARPANPTAPAAAVESPSSAQPAPSSSSQASSSSSSNPASSTPAASSAQSETSQPIAGGPTLLRSGITLRKVTEVPAYAIRLARNPVDGAVYLLHAQSGLSKVDLAQGSLTPVASAADMIDGVSSGLAFGPDGAAYLVGNKTVGKQTHAVVRRGRQVAGRFVWTTLAQTVDYPLSGTPFDHVYNGVAVSPDGNTIYVNAGSRTDHGEVEANKGAFPGVRELPLTSAIFALPANATGLRLDQSAETTQRYQYADGTRNAYSLAVAPTGELFGVDNGPDSDFPDELNQIEKGKHYGFPWRFGAQDNPQAHAGYDPTADPLLQSGSQASLLKTYRNDPTFPKAPGTFTDALPNAGPAAAHYRDDKGAVVNAAAASTTVSTFTPHRSPLGLVFSNEPLIDAGAPGQLHALVLSWGSPPGDLADAGRDLQSVTLTKGSAGYSLQSQQLATGFKAPIDEVLVGRHLYVLEWDQGGALWELTFNRSQGRAAG